MSDVTSPSNTRCTPTLSGLPTSVSATGGQFAVSLIVARECAWKMEADAIWIQLNPTSGQGETSVTVVVGQNSAGTSRTASLTVNETKTLLRQDAAPCRVTWTNASTDVDADGGTVTLGVSATEGCTWQASTTASWLRGTRTTGTGSGSAEFVASANEGSQRTATVQLGDASATVTQAAIELPLIATYTGSASGTYRFDSSGALSLGPGTYRITFNQSATIYVRGAAGGGGGGGGKRRDDGGSLTAGGGGGGGGAVSVGGQPVSVVGGTPYDAIVGSGGGGGAGASEGSGNIAGNGSAGGSTVFRLSGGTVYLQLSGGGGGAGGAITSGAGGAGGSVIAGGGTNGGHGGNGGVYGSVAAEPGAGTAGVTTGGGGGGGHSNEIESAAGGGQGGAGGASGGPGGAGSHGGNGGNGVADSGAGGEGALDGITPESAGGGGGGGKGVSVPGSASNRGGGGGGGGAINTGNSVDRGGNGGAGGDGALSIGAR